MSFGKAETQHQRRMILEVLNTDPSHEHNDVVLKMALATVGHTVSTHDLLCQLDWLEEQGFVVLNNVEEFVVVKLTQRGQDVATGASVARGITSKGL